MVAAESFLDVQSLPLVLTPEESWRLLRIGRSAFYEGCRQNLIPHTRIGKHIRCSRDKLLALMEASGIDGQTGTPLLGLQAISNGVSAGEAINHVGRR